MELWVDSADIPWIKEIAKYDFIHGVTTNPKLLAMAKQPPNVLVQELLEVQTGYVAVQVRSQSLDEMYDEAKSLLSLNERMIVKIPLTEQSMAIITELNKEQGRVMATALYHSKQVFLSAMLKCDYAAVYLGRMAQHQIDYEVEVTQMQKVLHKQCSQTKLLAAAIKDLSQLIFCAAEGVPAITLSSSILKEWIETDKLTLQDIQDFQQMS